MDASEYGKRFFITSRDGQRAEIYPLEVWERIESDLANLSPTEEKTRFLDAVNYYGQVIELDGQDRLLIPQKIREKADLKGEVAVLGRGERMEVVNDLRFVSRMEATPFRASDIIAIPVKGIS
jgi:MraZ protein